MIIYTEKIKNAILIAAALGGIQFRGRVLQFSDITDEVLESMIAEYTQFGFFKTQVDNEEAMFTWGDDFLKMKNLNDLKPEDFIHNDGEAFFPKNIIYEPVPGKEAAAELLKTIILNEDHKVIYNACTDTDAIYTFMRLYEYCGLSSTTKKINRMEIKTLLEKEIREAFDQSLSVDQSTNQIIAEKTRRYVYWITNINIRMALDKTFSKGANLPFKYIPLLNQIIERGKSRAGVQDDTSFRVIAQGIYEESDFTLKCKGAVFKKKEDAAAFVSTLPLESQISDRNEEIVKDYAKGPFNIQSLLQTAATHPKTGFRPEKTEDILKSLFDKGYITNINAVVRRYGKSQKQEIIKLLSMLKKTTTFKDMLKDIDLLEMPDEYFGPDDECGIIITDKIPSNKMTEEEKVLYSLICFEMIKTAYPPREVKKITCEVILKDAVFSVTDKKVVSPGYSLLEKKRLPLCSIPDDMCKDSNIKLSYGIEDVKQAPTELYSDQDIIRTFASSKNSIYTAADVNYGINLLLSREYIVRKGRKLLATELGEKVVIYLQDFPSLLDGKLIYDWEYCFRTISQSQTIEDAVHGAESLNDKVYAFLEDFRQQMKETQGGTTNIECPNCHSSLYHGRNGLNCRDCGWRISNNLSGRMFTEKELAYLIKNKSTPIIPGFSHNDKNVRGRIYLNDKNTAVFTQDSQYRCPSCGKNLHVSAAGDKYLCPSDDCSFEVGFRYYGHTLTNDEIRALLEERITPVIDNLKNDDGAFSARLYIDPSHDYSVRLAVVKKH